MKRLIAIFFLAFLLLKLTACSDDKKDAENLVWYGFPSLVDTYFVPNAIQINKTVSDDDVAGFPYVVLDWGWGDKHYAFDAENDAEKTNFEKYAIAYGDTLSDGTHNKQQFVSVLPVLSIDVVADKQFDDKHPAGSLLNDLIDINAWRDFYYALRYKREHNAWIYGQDELLRNLDSISASNPVYMLPKSFLLQFKKNPDTLGKYNLTISMKCGAAPVTGETVELKPVTVEVEFK